MILSTKRPFSFNKTANKLTQNEQKASFIKSFSQLTELMLLQKTNSSCYLSVPVNI
jgi:hypothetical protein